MDGFPQLCVMNRPAQAAAAPPEPQLSPNRSQSCVFRGFLNFWLFCNGEPIIPQVHYHHDDVGRLRTILLFVGGGFWSTLGGSLAR